jgi:DNA-binding CsgD family transcriptional regulator
MRTHARSAGASAPDPHPHPRLVLLVYDANPQTRAAVQQSLRNGGFAVFGDERPARNASLVSVMVEISVTLRQVEVLRELARCDGPHQMASALSVTEDAVENHLSRLCGRLACIPAPGCSQCRSNWAWFPSIRHPYQA